MGAYTVFEFTGKEISRLKQPSATQELAAAIGTLLQAQGSPRSIKLRSPEHPRFRSFTARESFVDGIYLVHTSMRAEETYGGGWVADEADFFMLPYDTYLDPDAILTVRRAFEVSPVPSAQVQLTQTLESLGRSVGLLVAGNAAPTEYWEIADSTQVRGAGQ